MVQLLGIPANDPKSRIARQFLFAQGGAEGYVGGRDIVLVGNAIGGTEPVESVPLTPFANQADVFARVGRRSPLAWMWRVLNMVAPQATVWPCVVATGGGAAAYVTFTFATTADNASTISIQWGTKNIQVGVSSGDTPATQATNVANAISADPDVPFTASPSTAVVTVTAACVGPRGTNIMAALRVLYITTIATTVTKSSVTAGTTADSFANALAALATKEIYYHVPECTCAETTFYSATSVTATDGGVGQYIANINAWALPAVGYSERVIFGVDATQAHAATAATSAAANAVLATFARVNQSDWTPAMVAAHVAGVLWLMENTYAGASLTNYTTNSILGTVFNIPDPYNKANRPLAAEISLDLNNGVMPVCFTSQGQAYLNRGIDSYNVLPGTSAKDYDARESHIPSVIHYSWAYAYSRWLKQRQPNVMGNLPAGRRPVPLFNTPSGLGALLNNCVDVLSSTACPSNNTPILDPSPDAVARMKASIFVQQTNNGLQASLNWEPVRHDNQDDFLVQQGGANT